MARTKRLPGTHETVSNLAVAWVGLITADRGSGMKWRVMVELTGSDGVVRSQKVSAGGGNASECSAATVGLTLADRKRTLAGLQDHLVRAQADEYCWQRRGCSHCGSQRPLKDVRTRRLLSLFGTVEVRAPRFLPCQCAVTSRHTLTPVAEIMPDRCTPEYERVIAKMGSLLPYARARALLSEFLPLGDVPAVETTRRRTLRVGARLEQQAASSQPAAPAAEARAISLFIDGGHVRSVRSYQVRSFEVMLAQVSNDDGKQVVFSSMPAEADRQRDQLRGVLHGLGATPGTPVTILSDGAEGPRSLGEAACVGPTRHVGLVPPVDANPARCPGSHELARRFGRGSYGRRQPCRDDRANQMAAMAWTGEAWSRSHRRNHGDAGSYGRSSIAGNAESDASSR